MYKLCSARGYITSSEKLVKKIQFGSRLQFNKTGCRRNSHYLFHLVQHTQGKILGSPRRSYDAVGNRLAQFLLCCPGFLRDREVFLQSGGTSNGNGTANPDQFAGFGIKYLFILVVHNFLTDLHSNPLFFNVD